MAANTLFITEASHDCRYLLRGDMDVSFDEIVPESFSVNFFTISNDTFVFKSTQFQFRDFTGALVNELTFGGRASIYAELRFDPNEQVWYVTSTNMVANDAPPSELFRLQELTAVESIPPLDGRLYDAFYITLSNPYNVTVPLIRNARLGFTYKIFLVQDLTANRTATFNSKYKFSEGRAPILSKSGGQIDFVKATPLTGGVAICEVNYNYATTPIARIGERLFDTMQAASVAVQEGDVIEILRAGGAAETLASFDRTDPPLRICIAGVPGVMPLLTVDPAIRLSYGKAILNPETGETYFRDFQANGAQVPESGNGAAVRMNPRTRYLQFDNMRFSKNENGILCAPPNPENKPPRDVFSLVIQDCYFDNNGQSTNHKGRTHNVYLQNSMRVYALRTPFLNSAYGHDFKNRSDQLLIDRCRFEGAVEGRALDTPNGGIVHAVNCYFRKPSYGRQSNLVGIGQEGIYDREQQYIFRNCLFENIRETNYQLSFINQQNSSITVYLVDCVFLANTEEVYNVGPCVYVYTGGHLGPEDYNGPAGFIPKVGSLEESVSAVFYPYPVQPEPIYGPDPTLEWFPPTGSTPTNTFAPHPQPVAVNTMATGSYPTIGGNIPIPDDTPPTVSLATTTTGTIVQPTNVTFVATAADNVRVTKVEFYKGGVLVDTDTSSPFTTIATINDTDNGTVEFTAKAFDAAGNNTTSNTVTLTVDIIKLPEPTVYPFSFSTDLTNRYNNAIDGAAMGAKRVAAANAIVTAMKPDYRMYVYQETDLIIPFEFTGDLVIENDGTNVSIVLGTPDSSDPLKAAKLAEGTWHFELAGGVDYQHVIKGSVGPVGSGKLVIISADPEPGSGNSTTFKLVIPRSVDGLS